MAHKPAPPESTRVMRTLLAHFFRRFFDNDTVQVEGDTITTVTRAVAIVAAPGLMAAFFLQTQYPQRSLWGSIEDQYLFVLYSFVVLGAAAVVEWEMLFPDRLDFLVLSPLSLSWWQMLGSKAAALAGFLALFLLGANAFGNVFLPAVTKGHFYRQVWAHTAATTLAGLFAALAVLALGGVMLCLLDPRRFRLASPLLQMASVVALTLLLLEYLRFGDALGSTLAQPLSWARWVPPFWFLGVYEQLLHGPSAPAFAAELALYAYRALGMAFALVLLTYPLAWARMQRYAIEGGVTSGSRPGPWSSRWMHAIVRRSGDRAVMYFITQTMLRNPRYQVYLALYGGLGLALAIACAVEMQPAGGRMRLEISPSGLSALVPLLLFWVVAGLRSAFALPLNLQAGWIFRVTAVRVGECADAARRWALWCALAVTAGAEIITAVAAWNLHRLVIQGICGISLSVLLTDCFFHSQEVVPFNRPRTPGLTNFPMLLTLYIAIFPLFVVGVMRLETRLETHLGSLILMILATVLLHLALVHMRREPELAEEEFEGYDEQFQLLKLS